MKDSRSSRPKRKKTDIHNEILEVQKKYGYDPFNFNLTNDQYLKKLSLSVSNYAGGMGSLKKGVTS